MSMLESGTRADSEAARLVQPFTRNRDRRSFLRMLGGVGVASAAVLAGCDSNGISDDAVAVNLGTGDVGVLNYAYALEQLEAAFYTRVVSNMFSGATEAEVQVLTDVRDHEIVHREFFMAALGDGAIPALSFDFGDVDFDERDSVLTTAQVFEDLGVAAYNGAGSLLADPDYLTAAGKIVSVEARHASAIRGLIEPFSAFALAASLVVEGLDRALPPVEVLDEVEGYINNEIIFSGLPTA